MSEQMGWTPKRLAYAALDHIKQHPETWDQTMWARRTACGTSLCFAGHVVHIRHPSAQPSFHAGDAAGFYVDSCDRIVIYEDEACELLDIERYSEESTQLFQEATIDYQTLESRVVSIFGPREESEHATVGA